MHCRSRSFSGSPARCASHLDNTSLATTTSKRSDLNQDGMPEMAHRILAVECSKALNLLMGMVQRPRIGHLGNALLLFSEIQATIEFVTKLVTWRSQVRIEDEALEREHAARLKREEETRADLRWPKIDPTELATLRQLAREAEARVRKRSSSSSTRLISCPTTREKLSRNPASLKRLGRSWVKAD